MRTLLLALSLLATPALAAPERVTVKVNGLVCDFCARAIEANMKRRKDVSAVHVDLDRGEVHLSLKDGSTLTDPVLTRLIVDSGYSVTGITRGPKP
jgi:copper chaperone CopZ